MRKSNLSTAHKSTDTKFVVLLASPRSGTHLLNSILTADQTISDTGESLRPNNFNLSHSTLNFWRFLRSQNTMSWAAPLTFEQRKIQWRAYLTFLSTKIPENIKILDFKYNNLRSADVGFLWPEEIPTVLWLAMQDRMPIIRLRRRNHLEVYCSLKLAHMTGEWSRQKDAKQSANGSNSATTVHVKPTDLLSELTAMQMREKLVDYWLSSYSYWIELAYEDLLKDGQLSGQVTEQIEQLLGHKIKSNLEPRTLKISPPLDKLVENYDEVEAALVGTPYAAFLSQSPT